MVLFLGLSEVKALLVSVPRQSRFFQENAYTFRC